MSAHDDHHLIRDMDRLDTIARLERENAELRTRAEKSERVEAAADSTYTHWRDRAETAERQLAEQRAQVAELLIALENAARMAEQGVLSTDEAFAAAEIRSLVPESARAALGSGDGGWPVPEGYALVPVEPTGEMIGAGGLASFKSDMATGLNERAGLIAAYRAMLAAAPAVEVAK